MSAKKPKMAGKLGVTKLEFVGFRCTEVSQLSEEQLQLCKPIMRCYAILQKHAFCWSRRQFTKEYTKRIVNALVAINNIRLAVYNVHTNLQGAKRMIVKTLNDYLKDVCLI